MRLKCIKLAGFKSFVDPTTVVFPSNLCAVVGPNGCGKSNIIDAVRWVMGESSAKHLRGESMADVIFNGSGGRKPVGRASIELLFDNAQATVGGEYASYSEISIKRSVERDGQSTYFLNSSRCRRRDITDIFLGTGLGPRSYSIIEQGMVSNLIESRPEELRSYIEEAAGISKYKERRKDTENRIARTRENLERLTDIRDELSRQLQRLERQSKAAEKYAELKKEQRLLQGQLLALRWLEFDQQLKERNKVIDTEGLKSEALITERSRCDTSLEKYRLEYTERNNEFSNVQGRYYGVGAEIARVEQSINHADERAEELRLDIEQTQRNFLESEQHLREDRLKLESWQVEFKEVIAELDKAKKEENVFADQLISADQKMRVWQSDWDEFNEQAVSPQREVEVQRARIEHLDDSLTSIAERIKRLSDEKTQLDAEPVTNETRNVEKQLAESLETRQGHELKYQELLNDIDRCRGDRAHLSGELNQTREDLQQTMGRQASLEALQTAALSGEEGRTQWLDKHRLTGAKQLADELKVDEGWETAVETALGDFLQAICVDGLSLLPPALDGWQSGKLVLLDAGENQQGVPPGGRLAEKIEFSSVSHMLESIYAVDTLDEAVELRSSLSGEESVISKDGHWFGSNWARVTRGENNVSGVLLRKGELLELAHTLVDQQNKVERQEKTLDEIDQQLSVLEVQRETLAGELSALARSEAELKSQLNIIQAKIEQENKQRTRITNELAEAAARQSGDRTMLGESRRLLESSIESMAEDSLRRDQLLEQGNECRNTLDKVRQSARHARDRVHELVVREQALSAQLDSVRDGIERLEIQLQRLSERQASLSAVADKDDDPRVELKAELEDKLARRLIVEKALSEARQHMEDVDSSIRRAEQDRSRLDGEIQKNRSIVEEHRILAQELETRRSTILEQLGELDYPLAEITGNMPEDASQKDWQDKLTQLDARIQRLGAINLAAMEEFKIESERKAYLDEQNDELGEALETLESAIRKINRETRTKFKETFEAINNSLQQLFPKLFGGGHAYLELTGEDLLEAGVTIMAQPPGKKNTTIHLLSGGEKSLTAIALVFSIFQLNPAPFCMLDEVDAPLDDANVARYANLVKEMSESVQFIYITHNKQSMEMAHQLMGVTMNEPGVSRMVTVDVDEAVGFVE
jgi:chromosome segregation protein